MGRIAALLLTVVTSSAVMGAAPAAAAGPAVKQYGPYASGSVDSGTCGNNWAQDTYDRFFRARTSPNPDGTYALTQDFKNGSFTTTVGLSPGSCETNPGGTITSVFTGTMQGSFSIVVTGGTYDANATCPAPCTTAAFVQAVYGAAATYTVPTFLFHYSAPTHGAWKNASDDRGGNQGDITG